MHSGEDSQLLDKVYKKVTTACAKCGKGENWARFRRRQLDIPGVEVEWQKKETGR